LTNRLARIAVLASLCVALVAAKDIGLSGKWVLDRGKSTSAGQDALPELLVQNIKMKGDDVKIQSSWQEPKSGITPMVFLGIMSSDLALRCDGKDKTNAFGPYYQVSKSTLEGTTLTTDWWTVKDGVQINGKWIRTMGDDGKSHTLSIKETLSDGSAHEALLAFKRK
jgi:hypothetical protein